MPSTIVTNTSILILIAGVVLLHLGAFLIRIGHWPRRTGVEPFCVRCNYLLAGLQSERCPECGQFLSARTIVRGQRHRRTGLTFAGAALVVLGAMLIPLSHSEMIWRMGR